jgi:hypothetical protein
MCWLFGVKSKNSYVISFYYISAGLNQRYSALPEDHRGTGGNGEGHGVFELKAKEQ